MFSSILSAAMLVVLLALQVGLIAALFKIERQYPLPVAGFEGIAFMVGCYVCAGLVVGHGLFQAWMLWSEGPSSSTALAIFASAVYVLIASLCLRELKSRSLTPTTHGDLGTAYLST